MVVDGALYYIDPKRGNRRRAVVPQHLQKRLLEETHAGPYGAQFSGQRMFSILVSSWWWECMFSDTTQFSKSCSECAITSEVGRRTTPPLYPIPVTRPFNSYRAARGRVKCAYSRPARARKFCADEGLACILLYLFPSFVEWQKAKATRKERSRQQQEDVITS